MDIADTLTLSDLNSPLKTLKLRTAVGTRRKLRSCASLMVILEKHNKSRQLGRTYSVKVRSRAKALLVGVFKVEIPRGDLV